MCTQIAENLNIPDDQWITASVWGYDSKAHFESGSNANLTVYSGYSSHNEYFTGDRSQTLIANSAWSQVNGGVPFGTSFGSLVAVRNYRGGTSEIWNGYGGFASTYCGTESQSWNDPSIASYDARNLTGTRFTPHDPPGVPAPYPFSTTSKTFVMPPSLVEDAEAAAVEEGEESAIGRFLWSLVPGSSLVDAYRDYQKGDYVSAGLNGVSGLSDLLSLGTITKAKSSLKLLVGFMKVRVKDSVVDAVANQEGNLVAERYGPEAGFAFETFVSAKLSKNVSQQNKTQLGFAADGEQNRQVPKAFQVAADGGRHAGFLKNRLGRSSESLLSEAKTLRQRATEHQVKINKRIGFGKVSDEPIFQYRADAGRIKHLEKEIQNFLEQAEIVEELARLTIGGNL